jgi:predicted nucleic acid-binding protein
MIFVDTSVWYAAYVEEEPEHLEADALLAAPSDRLVTTDYVVDELLTLFVARGNRPIAKAVGQLLWSATVCEVVWVERSDVEAAWQIFLTFDDKNWSFTDCVSYAVMKRLQITNAFALDEHFRQFGFAVVRP